MTTKYKTTTEHLDFCNTEYQRQIIEMTLSGMNQTEIARELGKDPRRIHKSLAVVHRRAALQGVAPAYNVNRQTVPGFTTKRVSTAYNLDGDIVLQWHIQEPERQKIEELIAQFVEGFKDEVSGIHTPINAPKALMTIIWLLILLGIITLGCLLTTLRRWARTMTSRYLNDC